MKFIALNQFFVFVCSVALGCVLGFIFSIKNVFKQKFKKQYIKVICDVFAFIICAFLFNYLTFVLYFPDLRAYILLGFFIGVFVHLKSFNLILAKFNKKLYNIIKNKRENNNERTKG